jgi:hypothetical protein
MPEDKRLDVSVFHSYIQYFHVYSERYCSRMVILRFVLLGSALPHSGFGLHLHRTLPKLRSEVNSPFRLPFHSPTDTTHIHNAAPTHNTSNPPHPPSQLLLHPHIPHLLVPRARATAPPKRRPRTVRETAAAKYWRIQHTRYHTRLSGPATIIIRPSSTDKSITGFNDNGAGGRYG